MGRRGVEEQNFYVIKFLWLEFLVEFVRQFGPHVPAFVTDGLFNHIAERKPSGGITHKAQSNICNPFDNSLIDLRSRSKRASGEIGHLYPTVRSLFHLLTPLNHQETNPILGGKETGEIERDRLFLRI